MQPQGMVNQAQAAPAPAGPPMAAPQGAQGAPPQGPPTGMVPPPEAAPAPQEGNPEEMTPEEDEAMESGMQMVSEILYNNDGGHEAVMEGLTKGKPEESIAEVTLFVVDQIEQQFNGNFPEAAVIPLADEISDMLLELGETKGIFKVDDALFQKSKGMMMQELYEAYGVSEQDLEGLMQGVTSEEVATMQQSFGGEQA